MIKKLMICFILCLMPSGGWAYVTDAPHNETNNVLCGDCHTYSLWWQYSPAEQDTDTGYGAITDAVCNSCHDNKPGFPSKIGHTVESMGVEAHDPLNPSDWSTTCLDCHDPHQQAQLDWIEDNATWADHLFLVTGEVDGPGSVTVDGNTTIKFNPGSILTNADDKWATKSDPDTPDPDNLVLTWETKNRFSKRGLIFVHDTDLLTNTYSIISVDSDCSTIVLRGEPDSPIDDNSTFGLIYGQLIKQQVKTSESQTRDVKFFDPQVGQATGGFVDANVPREGICQVCHTKTAYWHSDGTVVDADRESELDHYAGETCTECHDTDLGFRPVSVPHPWLVTGDPTCANCHLFDENGVLTDHGPCSRCHTTYPSLISSISGRSLGKWPTPEDDNVTATGNCYDCHNGNVAGVRDISGDFTNHLKAFDDDNNSSNGINGHAGQVTVYNFCAAACHYHRNKDAITQIHTGFDPITSSYDPCIKCHDLNVLSEGTYDSGNNTMITTGSYSGSGALRPLAENGPGDCVNCHGIVVNNNELHPDLDDHSSQVTFNNSELCATCHDVENFIGDKTIDYVHQNSGCIKCHNTTNNYALRGATSNAGPGSCVECHGAEDFYVHDINNQYFTYDHSETAVSTDPICIGCHIEEDMITGIHSISWTNPTSEQLCGQCHDGQGALIGEASGHGEATIQNPFTCTTCHTDKDNHPEDTDHTVILGSVPSCRSCHVGELTTWVHDALVSAQNECLPCHPSLQSDEFRNIGTIVPAGEDCITCHQLVGTTSYFDPGHQGPITHDGGRVDGEYIDQAQSCQAAECHPGLPTTEVHEPMPYLSCMCHASGTGVLLGSASGKGTGKPTEGDDFQGCIDCHSEAKYLGSTTHTNL